MARGELPIAAEIKSESGEPASMTIGHATFNGKTVIDDEITLTVNSGGHEKEGSSEASVSFPVDGSKPKIKTSGDGSVTNDKGYFSIKTSSGTRYMRPKNKGKVFAKVSVGKQRDTGTDYIDVLTGESGKTETTDESGTKDRGHLAFYPDGNGKYIRLIESGYQFEITATQGYDKTTKKIIPSEIRVTLAEYDETLVLKFSLENNSATIVIDEIDFVAGET